MATKSKIAERVVANGIDDIPGWLLICKDDDLKYWHIAWLEPFNTKKSALGFAADHRWPKPYRAVRGRITVR